MHIVAFQGEIGAYSERAAREFFGATWQVTPCRTFRDAFVAVHEGQAHAAIIPIENSLAGSVHQNYDLLLQYHLHITGEIILRISHHVMALPGVQWEQVRRVYSHPQALEQCREFLEQRPELEIIPAYDTAGSAKLVAENNWREAAAIASAQAAEHYGLAILQRGVESNHKNYTRFLVLEKAAAAPAAPGKTSIVFSTPHTPGALFKALAVFALRDINLLKIASRPLHGSPWHYLFYLDFEGTPNESRCEKALAHLGEISELLRVLGAYEKGRVLE
ncbi:prephenate dehydratase [candidate division KSB1 bacterium]|nr:prephenate dehydratase [candidate division KSB1 bacterium]